MAKRVLILDGSQNSSLAILRSLGRKGVECEVGEWFLPNLCTFSNYCKKKIKYPPPAEDPDQFSQFILKYISSNEFDAIYPVTDITIPLVLDILKNTKYKNLVSHINKQQYLIASDKYKLIDIAKSFSVPCPETFVVNESSDLFAISKRLDYPVVIKPEKSKIMFQNRIVSLNVKYAKNSKELVDILTRGLKYKINFLVQRIINGEGIGFFSLYQNGEPKRTFYHKRILEKPPSGGVSVLCESTAEDLKVKEYAYKILNELKWHGVAMVEFKKDYKTGIPYLMEINARFWGSLQLAILCGVDFPFDTFKMICGTELNPSIEDYKVGIRCSWITGLLDHFYLLSKDKKSKEILKSFKKVIDRNRLRIYDFVLQKDDPKPFFYEMYKYIKNVFL